VEDLTGGVAQTSALARDFQRQCRFHEIHDQALRRIELIGDHGGGHENFGSLRGRCVTRQRIDGLCKDVAPA
jgi:hypothetical protein